MSNMSVELLKDTINARIMAAMKSHDTVSTRVFQAVKAEIQKVQTARNAVPYDATTESSILRRLVKQHEESISQYGAAHRDDLVADEQAELDVLLTLLPAPVSEDQIRTTLNLLSIPHQKAFMGQLIKEIKRIHPTADGAVVARIVKESLEA